MKRHIKYIIVHSTATFDPRQSQYYGDFHFVVEGSGEIKRIHAETAIIKNVPPADNEAIHIAYSGGRNTSGNLSDTRTPVQEESLYNKLIALTVKYPSARIMGHAEFEASSGCPGFNVKEWLKQYEPEIAVA